MSRLFSISDIVCEGVSEQEVINFFSNDSHVYIKNNEVFIKNSENDLIDYLDDAIFGVEDVNNKTLFPILFKYFISDRPAKLLTCLPENFKEYSDNVNVIGVSFQDLLLYTGRSIDEIKTIITTYFNSFVAELFIKNIQKEPILHSFDINITNIEFIESYAQYIECSFSNRLSELKNLLYSNYSNQNISQLYHEISNQREFSTSSLLELEEILNILQSDNDYEDVFQIFEDNSKTSLIRLICNILSYEE